jgi:hypothetical protein
MAYEIILQGYGWKKGWEIITQIGANTKSFPTSATAVPPTVSKGDAAYGLAIDFYAWAEIDRNGPDRIGYVLPEGLTVIQPDSIGIFKGAPNIDLARKFEEFVLSDAGQSLWMLPRGAVGGPEKDTLGRMSILPGMYDKLGSESIVPVNPFKLKSTLTYDDNTASAHFAVLNDMIGSMIIDQHDALVAAWKEINDAATVPRITPDKLDAARAALGTTPLTQKQADDYGARWQDQVFRNQQITAWRQFAITKYGNATALLDKSQRSAIMMTQQEITYISSGILVIVIIGTLYVAMKRRNEVKQVKK